MNKKIQSFFLILLISLSLIMPINSFQGGVGTLADPYQISTCAELQNMSSCLSCNYTLIQNVNCGVSPYNTGNGFAPVGGQFNPFRGNFDGLNNIISNLYINRPNQVYVGLFGFSNNPNTKFNNTKLININITGNGRVGGLIGSGSDIYNSYTQGVVKGNISNDFSFVGGIVGYASGNIDNSYSYVDVYGGGATGGLIGYSTMANIDNSYAAGNVNGSTKVGGLIGELGWGTVISNSYFRGTVNGNDRVGGIAGYNNWANGKINNSFSVASSVNGNSDVGCFIGRKNAGNIINSFCNNVSNVPNNLVGLGDNTGIFAIQDNLSYFYDCSNEPMASWNLSNWVCSGTGLPTLAWQGVTPPPPSSSSQQKSLFPFQGTMITTVILILGYLFLS